jgi:hypothetical protein
MTTPDSFGSGGATGSGTGGLAAGPGDDQGEAAVTTEAETGGPGRPESSHTRPAKNRSAAPGTSGGLGEAGDTGPDLSEDDERTAADGGVNRAASAER